MGGIGTVVVNTIVRMFTKKAVNKAMKSAGSKGLKKGKTKKSKAAALLYKRKNAAKGTAQGKKDVG